MIFVHQMAKVASRSWIALGSDGSKDAMSAIHSHFVMPKNLERIRTALRGAGFRPTIANMFMPNVIVRRGERAAALIEQARRNGEVVRIVTGLRDPVARSISLIVFFADFLGHTSLPLDPNAPLSANDVIAVLESTWASVLEDREPDGTFEWLLWFMTGAYRDWFDEELLAAFGADVRACKFDPQSGAQRLQAPNADILVYRVEDMSASAPAHSRLLDKARDFLGTSIAEFPAVNTSQTRRSRVVSDEVRTSFRLPDHVLNVIYDASIMRHFYSDAEIEMFKSRWVKS